ncbi:hypothetical protein GCM10029964_036020 [Kibdelosporangium lantanae]
MYVEPVRVLRAGAVAAVLSGLPSTIHAVVTGRDVLASTRAAGTLVPLVRNRLVAGVVAHVAVSAFWTVVLAAVDQRRKLGVTGGAAAGLVIATLDLEVVGRLFPEVRALPRGPQWADHVAFGALVGGLL